jgi:cell fate regulator YaaT (PSP1 superfamily)
MLETLSQENLETAAALPVIPELKGRALDISGMPESVFLENNEVLPVRVVGVRYQQAGRVFDFFAEGHFLKINDVVVTDLPQRGLQMGWVAKGPYTILNTGGHIRLPVIVRRANEDDLKNHQRQKSFEERGLRLCQEAVAKHQLNMKILRVDYTLDLRKCLIFFSAETRVDFRNLLKDLVQDLRARVELRQIGVRDAAGLKGAIGPCGEETCCSRFLNRFHSVSIKMAKDQGLSLKPTKVSGMCGRLKCCLAYEAPVYEEGLKKMPKKGRCVKCSSGSCGVVKESNPLTQTVTVIFEDGSSQILPIKDILEETSLRPDALFKNELVIAAMNEDGSEDWSEVPE